MTLRVPVITRQQREQYGRLNKKVYQVINFQK